jgi:hypothetical protein
VPAEDTVELGRGDCVDPSRPAWFKRGDGAGELLGHELFVETIG